VLGDIARQCGFAHGRPASNHHELPRLEWASHALQVGKAQIQPFLRAALAALQYSGQHQARQVSGMGDLRRLAVLVGSAQHQVSSGSDLFARRALLENCVMRLVDGAQHGAFTAQITHHLGIPCHIGGARRLLVHAADVAQAASTLQFVALVQILRNRDRVSGQAVANQS